MESLARDSQELELGTMAAGHSWAGCFGQGFPAPSGSSLDQPVTVAAPFPPPLTRPAVMLVLLRHAWAGMPGKAQLPCPTPSAGRIFDAKACKKFQPEFQML